MEGIRLEANKNRWENAGPVPGETYHLLNNRLFSSKFKFSEYSDVACTRKIKSPPFFKLNTGPVKTAVIRKNKESRNTESVKKRIKSGRENSLLNNTRACKM